MEMLTPAQTRRWSCLAGENTSAACTELPRDNAAGEGEERALGRDTRHGTTEHGMVWVGSTLEIGWAVGRDTFH